jgi:hypothetical protein
MNHTDLSVNPPEIPRQEVGDFFFPAGYIKVEHIIFVP